MSPAYQHIKQVFVNHFKQLRRLEPEVARPLYNLECFMVQRTIGQYCYLAEEMLEAESLNLLKCTLCLDEVVWEQFKRQGIWGLDVVVYENTQQGYDGEE